VTGPVLAVVPFSDHFLSGRLFSDEPTVNRDDALRPWRCLRAELEGRGWEVATIDQTTRLPDAWLHLDAFRQVGPAVDPARTVVVLLEPEVVAPHWYDEIRSGSVDVAQIHLQDRRLLAEHGRTRYIRYPQVLPEPVAEQERDLPLVMVNTRKYPARSSDELYTERERIATWFARRKRIEIFGGGWDRASVRQPASLLRTPALRRSWRGRVDSKFAVLRRARAALCFENTRCPGYHTEKLFDAMAAGTVAVYLGDPDIHEVVDPAAFLDFRSVGSAPALARRLEEMSDVEAAEMRAAGRAWLSSAAFEPYKPESFARTIADALQEVIDAH
jgi:hypothetical protein